MTAWIKRELLSFKTFGTINADCNDRFRRPLFCDGAWSQRQVGSLKMQSFNADVQNRILALVKSILEQNAITAEVHADSRLVDVGLTSMDMVNLMLSVAAEF